MLELSTVGLYIYTKADIKVNIWNYLGKIALY